MSATAVVPMPSDEMQNGDQPARPERLLPSLELDAMKVLWKRGESSVAEVQQGLKPERDLAYTTVMTVLDRLHRKGAVSRVRQGRSFVYRPELTRDKALKMSLERLIRDFFANSPEELLAHLQGQKRERLEPSQLDSLIDSSLL